MNMTLKQAMKDAEKFTDEEAVPFDHWRKVMARLLEEVKAQIEYNKKNTIDFGFDADPCRCPACTIAEDVNTIASVDIDDNIPAGEIHIYDGSGKKLLQVVNLEPDEPAGPLPAAVLADMSDQLADFIANFAGELDMYHVRYEMDSSHFNAQAKRLVDLGKQLRSEA